MGSQGTGDERRHLTWRDLPPTPPTGRDWSLEPDLPAEVPPVAFEAEPARHRGRRRTFAVGAAAAALVAVGVVAAVAAPSLATGSAAISRSSSGSDQSLNGAAPSASTGGGQAGAGGTASNGGSGSSQPGSASPTAPPTGTSGAEPLADTAAKILPSVVQIETGGGLGSGFVADGKGDILTAAHVVDGASRVTVKTQDGSSVQGTVVATDTSIDVAVVRIARTDIPALPLADSDQVRVGQVAIAVGSPFGLDETVTSGIVSALNRTLDTGSTRQTGLIQTDTPINPGNSGGPLTDRSGNVIGINDAIASTSGQSSGVGFAVPINQAKVLLGQAQNGTVPSQSQPGSNGSSGQGTDPFGSNGTDPFGGLFGGSNPFGSNGSGGSSGSDPFGGLFGGSNPFGNSDPSQGGSGSQQDQLFQWFFGQVLPGLGQGQSGATQ